MTAPRLYHGGVPGLRVGDLLTGGQTRRMHEGCAWCQARADGTAEEDRASEHPDDVYVSASRPYSRFYASLWGLGDLYRVEPVDGDLVPSTEDTWASFRAPAVRVAAVLERAVRLTDHDRRALMRQWRRQDLQDHTVGVLANVLAAGHRSVDHLIEPGRGPVDAAGRYIR